MFCYGVAYLINLEEVDSVVADLARVVLVEVDLADLAVVADLAQAAEVPVGVGKIRCKIHNWF
jgi:hypothetical protein